MPYFLFFKQSFPRLCKTTLFPSSCIENDPKWTVENDKTLWITCRKGGQKHKNVNISSPPAPPSEGLSFINLIFQVGSDLDAFFLPLLQQSSERHPPFSAGVLTQPVLLVSSRSERTELMRVECTSCSRVTLRAAPQRIVGFDRISYRVSIKAQIYEGCERVKGRS